MNMLGGLLSFCIIEWMDTYYVYACRLHRFLLCAIHTVYPHFTFVVFQGFLIGFGSLHNIPLLFEPLTLIRLKISISKPPEVYVRVTAFGFFGGSIILDQSGSKQQIRPESFVMHSQEASEEALHVTSPQGLPFPCPYMKQHVGSSRSTEFELLYRQGGSEISCKVFSLRKFWVDSIKVDRISRSILLLLSSLCIPVLDVWIGLLTYSKGKEQ